MSTESIVAKYSALSKRYNALFQFHKLSYQDISLDNFYQQLHEIVATLVSADNFYIVLFDQDNASAEFVYHHDEQETIILQKYPINDIEGSLTKYLYDLSIPLYINEQTKSNLKLVPGQLPHSEDVFEWLGVPLIEQNTIIGMMAVQNYQDIGRNAEDDLELLNFTGQQVVTTLVHLNRQVKINQALQKRNTELIEQIRERERSELLQESLYKISELSNNSTIDINKFYEQVHNIVGQLINAENFYIVKLDKNREELSFVFYLDQFEERNSHKFRPRKLGNYYTELVIKRCETVLLSYSQMLALHEQENLVKPDDNTCYWLGVPLMLDGEVMGAMVVQSYQPDITYTPRDAELINFVARHVASAIQRRELLDLERQSHEILERQVAIRTEALKEEINYRIRIEEQLKYAATHDSLTGLANRRVFLDLLSHAIACRKRKPELQFALLFLDLDRFKVVNDSLGHLAGDKLLKIVAHELTSFTREKDTVARLGGDEFVILIEDLTDHNEAFIIAERITNLLNEPIMLDNQQVFIGTSIGILFSDDRYTSAEVMLRDADTAMYHAKEKGKGRYEVFDTSMQQKVENTLQLEVDIRQGINLSEFVPYFQPIVHLASKTVVGFEALARWNSSKRGLVFPNDFIQLAEDTGLVKGIDFQIIEKSCLQLKAWQKSYQCEQLYVSCNLHCDHFFSPNLASEILSIIKRVGIKPEQLRLEITERTLLEQSELVLDNMNQLKAGGVKIVLDDFGTGYSSLSYLHRFPIDVLKIDQSFISNIHEHQKHRAIIKTIIDLASNLHMTTVGEGIEHLADAQLLNEMDCNYGQGYFFSQPLSAQRIENSDVLLKLIA